MHALVTGGTGFVGGAVVRELLSRRHHVRVLARATSKTKHLEALDVEIVRGDILERASIEAALTGCDTLFHAAAIYEFWVTDQEKLQRTEIEGTRNAMEAALAAGLEKVVYTSTGVTVGEPHGEIGDETTPHRGYFLTAYERAKYEAEQVAKSYRDRLDIVILKPGAVLGPGDRKPTGQSIINALNGRFPALFDGVLSAVDIEDVARGHVVAAERNRWDQDYILAGQVISNADFFGLVCELGGVRRPVMAPHFLARLFASFEECKARFTRKPPLLSADAFRVTAHGFRVSGAKAARELGISYTPVEDSLRRAIRWYWDQGLLRRRPACLKT